MSGPDFLAYKIWAANEFGHSVIRTFGHLGIRSAKLAKQQGKNSKKNGTNSVIRTFGRTFGHSGPSSVMIVCPNCNSG